MICCNGSQISEIWWPLQQPLALISHTKASHEPHVTNRQRLLSLLEIYDHLCAFLTSAGELRVVITPATDKQPSMITISHHSAEDPPWQHDEDAALDGGGESGRGDAEADGEPSTARGPSGRCSPVADLDARCAWPSCTPLPFS